MSFCNTNFLVEQVGENLGVGFSDFILQKAFSITSMPGDPFGGAIVQGTGVVDFAQRVVQVDLFFQFLLYVKL